MISPSLDHLPFELHGADASLAIEQRIPLSRIRGHREQASEVELEATKAFLTLYERRQMLRIVTIELDLARQVASAANARYAAATGMQPEVLRAEIEVARAEGMLKSLSSEIEEAEAMLNSSLARAPEAQLPALAMTATAAAPSSWVAAGTARGLLDVAPLAGESDRVRPPDGARASPRDEDVFVV
jgi:hypothetical protein